MFELQLGDKLSIKELYLREAVFPFVLVGKPGQGKSVFLVKLALELIKNQQTGVLYDPFGDLSKRIQEFTQSDTAKKHIKVFSHDEEIDFSLAKTHFLLVAGNQLRDGTRTTQEKAKQVLDKAIEALSEKDWLLVDEAFSFLTDELFDAYLAAHGPKRILSSQTFLDLSEKERKRLFAITSGVFVCKPRNIDIKWLCEHFSRFEMKSMMAIKQYHFQYIYPHGEVGTPEEIRKKASYDAIPWPLASI